MAERLETPKGAKSIYWAHFGFEVDKDGRRIDEKNVRCHLCNKAIGYSGNTTNLSQHLNKWHPEVLSSSMAETSPKSLTQVTLKSCAFRPTAKMATNSQRAQQITQGIAEFIARDMRPISVIEGKGFQNLLAIIDPSYQVPSRKHVMKNIQDMYSKVRLCLLAEMEDIQSVGLTTDHWTSRAMDSYLGVTVHFITQDWELKKRVLQVRQVKERHTGNNVASDLKAVTTEWNLDSKVTGVTTDNTSNMVAALVLLPWPRMPCFAHTLQLAVKDGLKVQAVADILTRCKKIVGHFKPSLVASAALEETQKRLGLPKKKLVQEVPTRWNSSYTMLSCLVEQQVAVSAVLAESSKTTDRDLILSSAEIAAMECAISVLQPLAQATEMLGGEKIPSISVIQPVLTALRRKHLQTSAVEPQMAVHMKQAIAKNIDNHFSDVQQRNLMLCATCLDPRFK